MSEVTAGAVLRLLELSIKDLEFSRTFVWTFWEITVTKLRLVSLLQLGKVQKSIFRSLLMDPQAHCWLIPGMYQTIKNAPFLSPTQSGCIKVSSRRFRRRRVNKSEQQTEITLHPFNCNAGHSSTVLSWSSCGLILGVAWIYRQWSAKTYDIHHVEIMLYL